jgi:hypothetical protein
MGHNRSEVRMWTDYYVEPLRLATEPTNMRATQQHSTIESVALAATRRDSVAWYPTCPICNRMAFVARGVAL